ncbi:MAG: DUF445 domain-containing protein, partial [Acidimicrobiales bacterium]
GSGTWAGYVQATAEASLVGGLADWFAITALFRHPLGLPIPHTAIIAERKEQFGATLGEFIQESFLTPEVVITRLRAAGVVDRAGEWLAVPDHAARLADHVVSLVDLLRDEEVGDAIAATVRRRLESLDVTALAARVLRYAVADDRHQEVIDAGLTGLHRYLDAHGPELHARLAHQSPWWLPGAVEDRIFERLLDGARNAITEMVGHPENPLRRDLDKAIAKLIADLESSPDLRARGEQLKRELLGQPQLREWAGAMWSATKEQLRDDDELRARLARAIASGGARLRDDPELRARAEDAVERVVALVSERFSGEIVDLVSQTIARWDTSETSRRLELLLGPDLQYIRINGTVVGGAAGLALYSAARLLA